MSLTWGALCGEHREQIAKPRKGVATGISGESIFAFAWTSSGCNEPETNLGPTWSKPGVNLGQRDT